MSYYFYFPPENNVIVARNRNFLERDLISQKFSGRDNDLEDDHMDTLPFQNTSKIPVESESLGSPPELIHVNRSKWLYKKKTDMDGKAHTYKARLVAKGCTQTYGIDYEETFSPVADIRAIRILIAITAYYDYEIWQMDVKTAFLN
nr:putative retrotransposon Ty1-copia subclass protein [Tanacetum cinerariifolium]